MLFSGLHINRFGFALLRQNLKLLNLKAPVTQAQIKLKYRELAKKYHPDTLKQKSTKQTEQYFVKITTAYNQLKQLTDKQLSVDDSEQFSRANMSAEQRQATKSQQQKLRQETYSYFNKGRVYSSSKDRQRQPEKKPLYKTVPELFVGCFFVLLMMSDWLYRSTVKTSKQVKVKKADQKQVVYENVFKGLNSNRFITKQKVT